MFTQQYICFLFNKFSIPYSCCFFFLLYFTSLTSHLTPLHIFICHYLLLYWWNFIHIGGMHLAMHLVLVSQKDKRRAYTILLNQQSDRLTIDKFYPVILFCSSLGFKIILKKKDHLQVMSLAFVPSQHINALTDINCHRRWKVFNVTHVVVEGIKILDLHQIKE